jgi:hypothetical protein
VLKCAHFRLITARMTKKTKKKTDKRFEIERLKEMFSETLFVVSLAFVFFSVLFVSVVRSQELINMAEMLPAADTAAFWVYDMDDYTKSGMSAPTLFGQTITQYDWFNDQFGTAVLGEDLVHFLDIKKRSDAKASLEEMLIEDESFTEDDEQTKIYCFEYSHPDCFMFFADTMITSKSKEALQKIRETRSGAETVESLSSYQNAKGRMPLTTDLFAFVNLEKSRQLAFQALGSVGIFEPGYLESVLRIFPALTFVADLKEGQWDAEMFLAASKEVLGNEAFYRSGNRYDGNLLELSSDDGFAFEWGGMDLAAQLQRLSEILQDLNPAAALVFDSSLKSAIREYFGDNIDADSVYQLLENEYYFGWTPDEEMLLMLSLEEGGYDLAEQIKDLFAANYRVPQTYEKDGETKAEIKKLEGFASTHDGERYYHFSVDGKEYIFMAIMDNLAVVSTSRDEFFAVLDRIKTRQNLRNTNATGMSLWGVSEMFTVDMEFFPEGHILKTALKNFGKISQTRKLFDDGIYSKFQLEVNSQSTDDNQSEYRSGEGEA